MGKAGEISALVNELRSCGKSILAISDNLAKTIAPTKPRLTFEDVRHRMTVIARAGFASEVKALIIKYGAERLSDIDPSDYPSLVKEADALGRSGVDGNG